MEAYEFVTEFLNESGVDTLFTLQSDGNMRLLAHVQGEWADDVRLIKARHEQAATAMADGYARVSDGLGVCTVGRGPAVAHTGASLVTARERGSDLLLVVPEMATDATFDIKGFEQETHLRTTIGNVVTVRDEATVVPGVRDALRRVKTGDGPAAVQIAEDVLNGSVELDPEEAFAPVAAGESHGTVTPAEADVAAAVDLYLDSDVTKAPVVLAGRGAVRADAHDAVVELAERMNALLATTVQGRGYFGDHPFGLGFVGHYGGNLANEYVLNSDFVLAVGCGLNPYTTDDGHVFGDDAKLVHVDADPAAIERHTPVDLGIVGDATATVEAFASELDARGIDRTDEFWTESLRNRIATASPFEEQTVDDEPGTVDPRELVTELNRLLPEDRVVVSDTGHHTRWVLDAVETPTPDDFVWPGEFGSIGLGLPMGIGATLAADDDRTCVTICGDAGFMMTSHEVETAARYDVPVIVVVMNDSALGTEYHSLAHYSDEADVSVIDTPELADVAAAMGARGETVRSIDDLRALADTLGERPDGPVVVDCKIHRDVMHRSKR